MSAPAPGSRGPRLSSSDRSYPSGEVSLSECLPIAPLPCRVKNSSGVERRRAAPMSVVVGRFDQIVRPGLTSALRSEQRLEVLAENVDATALECAIETLKPVLIIVSQSVGTPAIARMKTFDPNLGVVVLANEPLSSLGWRLLAQGATCVAQGRSLEELVSAIVLTGCGGRAFLGAHGERVERDYSPACEHLTPTEAQSASRSISRCSVPRNRPGTWDQAGNGAQACREHPSKARGHPSTGPYRAPNTTGGPRLTR